MTTEDYGNPAAANSGKTPASFCWRSDEQKPWGTTEISLLQPTTSSSYFSKLSIIFKGMDSFLCVPQDLYPYKTKLGAMCLIACGIYYEEYSTALQIPLIS